MLAWRPPSNAPAAIADAAAPPNGAKDQARIITIPPAVAAAVGSRAAAATASAAHASIAGTLNVAATSAPANAATMHSSLE